MDNITRGGRLFSLLDAGATVRSLRSRLRPLPYALAACAALSAGAAPVEAAAGTLFPDDVASAERSLSEDTRLVTPIDLGGEVFGDSAGTLVVVTYQDATLRSRRSTNGGSSFGAEQVFAGPAAGTPEVVTASASLSDAGVLHLLAAIADPGGDVGLQAFRTSDFGASWSGPIDLLRRPGSDEGTIASGVAAGPGGRVAVSWVDRYTGFVSARVSSDGGATWSAPRRVDAAQPGPAFGRAPRMGFTPSGTFVLAYQVINAFGTSEVRVARSLDEGASFEPALALGPCGVPGLPTGDTPDLVVTNAGSVIVAQIFGSTTEVYRSTNGGASFTCSASLPPVGDAFATAPRLAASSLGDTVQLAVVEQQVGSIFPEGLLRLARSSDDGASFAGSTQLGVDVRAPGTGIDLRFDRDEAVFGGGLEESKLRFVETGSGTWVVAFDDNADSIGRILPLRSADAWLSSSSDGGVSWSAPERASVGSGASDSSSLAGLTAIDPDDVVVTYLSDRDELFGSTDAYLARSNASSLSFGSELSLEPGEPSANTPAPCDGRDARLATIAPSTVLAAYSCPASDGTFAIYVARSTDGGANFSPAVEVSRADPAEQDAGFAFGPIVATSGEGNAYVAYNSLDENDNLTVRINSSSDGGATWQATDTLLASASLEEGVILDDLATASSGRVYVSWSEGADVWLARSSDGGASFSSAIVDDVDAAEAANSRLCAVGSRVVLTYSQSESVALIEARISDDSGATFGPVTELSSATASVDPTYSQLACASDGSALAAWPQFDNTFFVNNARARRLSGTTWLAEADLGNAPPEGERRVQDVVFVDDLTAIVSTRDIYTPFGASLPVGEGRVHRSTDGGASFAPPLRLDDAAPTPASIFSGPYLAVGSSSALFATWEDGSAGAGSIVVRGSSDGGASFGSPRRVSRETPQGAFTNDWPSSEQGTQDVIAALGDRAFLAWGGERGSGLSEVIFNSAALSGGSATSPGVVDGLRVEKGDPGFLVLSWQPDCGLSSAYGVYRGDLTVGYGSLAPEPGECSVTGTTVTIPEGAPAGEFFLVVPNDGSGEGSFGTTSEGTRRDAPSSLCFGTGPIDACAP